MQRFTAAIHSLHLNLDEETASSALGSITDICEASAARLWQWNPAVLIAGAAMDRTPPNPSCFRIHAAGSSLGMLELFGLPQPFPKERRILVEGMASALLLPFVRRHEKAGTASLLSGLLHDIRSPLRRNATLTELKKTEPELASSIDLAVLREGLNFDRLLGGLASIAETYRPYAPATCESLPALDRACYETRNKFRMAQVSLCHENLPNVGIAAEESDLSDLFKILIDNSLNVGAQNIVVGAGPDTCWGGTVIRFSDDGPGLPLDRLAKVFEPFYRYHALPAGAPGLGLYAAGLLSKRMGGWIAASAGPPPGGLTIEIALPKSDDTL